MAGILKFTTAQSEAIMERFRVDLERNLAEAENEYPNNFGSSGYAEEIIDLAESYINIVDSAGYEGIRVTAQAIEEIEREYASPLNDLRYFIIEYIEQVDKPSATRYTDEKNAEQEQNITEIRIALDEKINQILDALDQEMQEEEERKRKKEDEERQKEERRKEREKRREEQKQIESEYYKTRSNLQKQIRRRQQKGVYPDVSVPDIPQRITEGSIRRLDDLIDYLQDEYRYIPWAKTYRDPNRYNN